MFSDFKLAADTLVESVRTGHEVHRDPIRLRELSAELWTFGLAFDQEVARIEDGRERLLTEEVLQRIDEMIRMVAATIRGQVRRGERPPASGADLLQLANMVASTEEQSPSGLRKRWGLMAEYVLGAAHYHVPEFVGDSSMMRTIPARTFVEMLPRRNDIDDLLALIEHIEAINRDDATDTELPAFSPLMRALASPDSSVNSLQLMAALRELVKEE